MKKSLILFISIINIAFAQKLSFDTKFYDAEDKWVVFDKKEKQNTYALGFIYFDPQFGYTFDYAGELEFKNNKFERLPRLDTTTIKNRLDINTFPVAILPDEKVKEFKLDPQPEWLKNYKLENSDFIENRIRRASLMNGAGASEKALKILQQAYIEDPHYPGLEFELGYAYNAIGSFYKAVIVLNKAIENDPINFWYYRELGFSLKHLNNLPEAEKAYRKAISLTADKDHIAEVAINMAQSYFHTKDKVNFDAWRKIVVENAEPDSQFMAYIQYFDENWHKPK